MIRLISEINERSVYLMDREMYIEGLFDRIKKNIALLPLGISGVSGTGYDIRGIICGFPAEYLSIYSKKDHAKLDFYKKHIAIAQKVGYATKFSNDVKNNYPSDYEERYKQFGHNYFFRGLFWMMERMIFFFRSAFAPRWICTDCLRCEKNPSSELVVFGMVSSG